MQLDGEVTWLFHYQFTRPTVIQRSGFRFFEDVCFRQFRVLMCVAAISNFQRTEEFSRVIYYFVTIHECMYSFSKPRVFFIEVSMRGAKIVRSINHAGSIYRLRISRQQRSVDVTIYSLCLKYLPFA